MTTRSTKTKAHKSLRLDVERDLAMAQSDRFFSSYEPEADEISGEWMR
jgi:hypothetical protein